MYWNKFDIVEAHYTFYSDYHSGQFSKGYEKLSRISRYFTPSRLFKGYASLSENSKEIYNNLVAKLETIKP